MISYLENFLIFFAFLFYCGMLLLSFIFFEQNRNISRFFIVLGFLLWNIKFAIQFNYFFFEKISSAIPKFGSSSFKIGIALILIGFGLQAFFNEKNETKDKRPQEKKDVP